MLLELGILPIFNTIFLRLAITQLPSFSTLNFLWCRGDGILPRLPLTLLPRSWGVLCWDLLSHVGLQNFMLDSAKRRWG